MKTEIKPAELWLAVYGDWSTIIGARDYREALLNQKPDREDDAMFNQYRIPCKDTDALLAAAKVFRDQLKLECHVCIHQEGPEKNITAMSGCGWGKAVPEIIEYHKKELLEVEAIIEQRDELKAALTTARTNARNQHNMTLRKFAELCGHSPSWVSLWTNSEIDTPPDLIN